MEDILDKLLTLDLYRSANQLGFSDKPSIELTYEDVCNAIFTLNELALDKNEDSYKKFIAISGLLWEFGKNKFYGIEEALITLLSKIGYAPSSIIIDEEYKGSDKFLPFASIMRQWQTAFNIMKYEVKLNDNIFLLTDFQYQIWNATKSQKVTAISAPTSAGKSFVILLEAARQVIENNRDVIYLVPTLSLVNQVTEDFIRLFKKLKWHKYHIINSYNPELISDRIPQIFILTQERAIAAFSLSETPFAYDSMLIIDEVQNIERINDDGAEMRSKILLDSIYEFRFLETMNSIVISGPRISNIGELGKKLFGLEYCQTISTEISPVVNLTYSIREEKKQYRFTQYYPLDDHAVYIPISKTKEICGQRGKQYNDKFIDYMLSLIHKLGGESQNLIFSPTTNQARETALAISSSMPQSENRLLKSLSKYLKNTVHQEYSLSKTVLGGTAYHHGKLPLHVRKVIEYASKRKLINNITCTTTLMQGVNLPAQNVIIRNPHLYIKRDKASTELSSYELSNLRGRAGRLLKDFVGRTYILDENEFLSVSDEYDDDNLFSNTHTELDSSYEKTFNTNEEAILEALIDNDLGTALDESYSFLVTHIRQTALKYGLHGKHRLEAIGIHLPDTVFREMIKSLGELDLPKTCCLKNRYWDPFVLNELYSQKDEIPTLPANAFERGLPDTIRALLKYLRVNVNYKMAFSKRVPSVYQNDKMLPIFCSYAAKWAKETPLAKILNKPYHSEPNHIDETVALLQNSISFDLPFLLRPLYDILEKDGTFLTILEMGAFKSITRKLIEIGIPRETAISLENNVFKVVGPENELTYEYIRGTINNSFKSIPFWQRVQVSFIL